jgi:hypothetical protein
MATKAKKKRSTRATKATSKLSAESNLSINVFVVVPAGERHHGRRATWGKFEFVQMAIQALCEPRRLPLGGYPKLTKDINAWLDNNDQWRQLNKGTVHEKTVRRVFPKVRW